MADSCSKQGYITFAMVDSCSKNLSQGLSVTERKVDLISKCETCKDDEVSHKCETCDCEAPHTASDSDGGCHTSKTVSSSAEEIQIKLQEIVKESTKSQEKVIIDSNNSTKLKLSTNQSADGQESKKDNAADKSQVSEVSGSLPTDYTTAVHRDSKAVKCVLIDGAWQAIRVDNIQRYDGHLYCMTEEKIHVYTEHLVMVKTVKLNRNGWADCRAFACMEDKYLITASSSVDKGLRILNTQGKEIRRICKGEFYGLTIRNDKVYAYEYNINKVLIFEKTRRHHWWKKTGEIYLDYNGNTEHEANKIQSFLMENEQIYITDDNSIYHLDMKGELKRKIKQGKDNQEFKNPKICSVDSKGNLLVAEPENRTVTVVRTDGNSYTLLLRMEGLRDIYSAYMGDENECVWVAHYVEQDKSKCRTGFVRATGYLTKYRTNSIIM